MPALRDFRALRYSEELDLPLVTAPPYDVISAEQRRQLQLSHPSNIVHLTLGSERNGDDETQNKYTRAGRLFRQWIDEGVLVFEDADSLYFYRADFAVGGERRSSAGLVGALELEVLGAGAILPHERTMPEPKADRLELMRTTRANLEPLWFVASESLGIVGVMAEELAGTAPLADVRDPGEVRHRLWRLPPRSSEKARRTVASVELVVADGHHRYETALTYRDERRVLDGEGPWDATLALIEDPVDLPPVLLPIHRLVDGIGAARVASSTGASPFEGTLDELRRSVSRAGPGTVGLADAERRWTFSTDAPLDTAYLAEAVLQPLEATPTYEHDFERVIKGVEAGGVAFVLAAIDVEVVVEFARSRRRMPPKTTLFWPKPLSGLVLRDLDSPESR